MPLVPENPARDYAWAVTLAYGVPFPVEAAYPVIDDGHLLLKDSAHKIVFAAAPGTGCTVRRGAPAAGAVTVPLDALNVPAGCACSYAWEYDGGTPGGRWTRNVGVRCKASDHTEIDQRVALSRAVLHGFGDAGGPPV